MKQTNISLQLLLYDTGSWSPSFASSGLHLCVAYQKYHNRKAAMAMNTRRYAREALKFNAKTFGLKTAYETWPMA
jgi:hypothetical protein